MPENSPANTTPGLTDTVLDAELDFDTFEAFREQAAETVSFIRATKIKGFEIPNPSNLDPDQAKRYNELQFSLEDLDRWPDFKNDGGEVIRLGALKEPHRKGKVLLEDYDTRLAKAILGAEHPKFIEAGGRDSDVKIAWTYMNVAAAKRVRADPKSVDGAVPAEAVSQGD